MASCIKINSDEKKRNLIAMLSGDVEQVELLLEQNNGKPLPVFDADWGYQYYYIDSHQLAYVLYDALAYDDDQTWFKKGIFKNSWICIIVSVHLWLIWTTVNSVLSIIAMTMMIILILMKMTVRPFSMMAQTYKM